MARKHIPIDTWLEALGLKEYEETFSNFEGVEVNMNTKMEDFPISTHSVEAFPTQEMRDLFINRFHSQSQINKNMQKNSFKIGGVYIQVQKIQET